MTNVIDYAREQLDTFEQRPFCAVDSLALTFLAYITVPSTDDFAAAHNWEGMRIADLYRAEHFATYFDIPWARTSGVQLLTALAASPRFRDITLHRFVQRIEQNAEMQFSAMTFRLPDGSSYVAFKGTDSTLVGWKEDFNLSFQCPVPSQVAAVAYLEVAAAQCEGPLYTGGHSKGGNLAVYAAAKCQPNVQDRIMKAYSHDGPGFLEEFMGCEGYLRVAERVDKTIPGSSIIGMLMEQGEYSVVESDAHGMMQHDPTTWQVEGCDFVRLDKLANNALFAEAAIGQWMLSLSVEQRQLFIDSMYAVLQETNAERFDELAKDWRSALPALAKALQDMDPEARSFAGKTISNLLVIAAKNTPELIGVRDLPSRQRLEEVKDSLKESLKDSKDNLKETLKDGARDLRDTVTERLTQSVDPLSVPHPPEPKQAAPNES